MKFVVQQPNFWTIELTKIPILPNYKVPNGLFFETINLITEDLRCCKMAQLFLSVFLVNLDNLRELGENLKHKIRTWMFSFPMFTKRRTFPRANTALVQLFPTIVGWFMISYQARPCTITRCVIVRWNRHRTIHFYLMCTLLIRTKIVFT